VTLLAKFDGAFVSHASTSAGAGPVRYSWQSARTRRDSLPRGVPGMVTPAWRFRGAVAAAPQGQLIVSARGH
jgi:hypothetical protein